MRTRTLTALLATTAIFASLAGAQAASADSIAYVKGGSVWLSTADGARQFQVTDGGGYSEVSQSDDGHLVALHGDKIAYLDRQGNVLADIATPVSTTTDPTMQFKGPFDPVISPDGKKVAYTYYWQYVGQDPYCNPANGCYVKRLYQGVGLTYPDRLTAWDEPGMRRQSGWIHPSWIDNDKLMLSDPAISPNEDIVFSEPGKDKDAGFTRWFSHPGAKGWHDAEITRAPMRKLAGITGDADDHLLFAYVDGLPEHGGDPHYPTQCPYEIKDPAGGKFGSLSWSPSGTALAYSDGGGISTIAIPAFGSTYGDCGTPREDVKLIIPGGESPSWGPADVPAPRPMPTPTPGPTPTPTSTPTPTPPPAKGGSGGGQVPGGGIVIGGPSNQGGSAGKPAARLRLAAVLAKGLPLTVQVSGAGTVTVTVKSGGKTVATGKAKAKAAGSTSVRATFSKAARKRLGKSKQAKFAISTRFNPTGGGTTLKRSATVTIKR